jgi:glycosyltransferase involved in cell wall biosynthesis
VCYVHTLTSVYDTVSKQMYKFRDVTNKSINSNVIDSDTKIIFVSDLYVKDYVGGAELTTQALIDVCKYKHVQLRSSEVTLEHLRKGIDKHWIFGNFSQLDFNLIPSIVANLSYSILEYDYKYCKYRSAERHFYETNIPCDCHNQLYGKLIAAFFYGAKTLFWMSEKQKEKYLSLFPDLIKADNIVLSSVFDDNTLNLLKTLKIARESTEKKGWIVLGSSSWIKGQEDAVKWCVDNGKEHEIVWNLPYNELLQKLSNAEGHVYLPRGADTCPRLTIEAKLLGLDLHLNDNVQHSTEDWFKSSDLDEIEQYLRGSKDIFWNVIKKHVDYQPTISGYMTAYNCISQEYPFEKTIQSMSQFCDEICVVDGGSTDGTWERLRQIQEKLVTTSTLMSFDCDESRLAYYNNNSPVKLKQVLRDGTHPCHAVFDGMQKAEARKMCTKEFCWQMDSDEVVHEKHVQRIKDFCKTVTSDTDLVCLPVIEYWGSVNKVRLDVTPWKWRLSRNRPHITHGIPVHLRAYTENGQLYALEGTDGCDMIHVETGEVIPHLNFWNVQLEQLRRNALTGDRDTLANYEKLINVIIEQLPCVFHYSWFDIERKIRLYRNFWQNHWNALFNKSTNDTAENNMFFDVPWSEVTDDMISSRAKQLAENTGGWVFHRKWTGQRLPYVTIEVEQPKIMK